MTSYYLVQDDKGLFYIRRRILGIWGQFMGRTDEITGEKPYWWPEDYTHHAYFKTEDAAISRWEEVRKYPTDARQFKVLRKLS